MSFHESVIYFGADKNYDDGLRSLGYNALMVGFGLVFLLWRRKKIIIHLANIVPLK